MVEALKTNHRIRIPVVPGMAMQLAGALTWWLAHKSKHVDLTAVNMRTDGVAPCMLVFFNLVYCTVQYMRLPNVALKANSLMRKD